jgi:hypothetical protein
VQADLDEARRAETDALAASSSKTGARTNRIMKEQLKQKVREADLEFHAQKRMGLLNGLAQALDSLQPAVSRFYAGARQARIKAAARDLVERIKGTALTLTSQRSQIPADS